MIRGWLAWGSTDTPGRSEKRPWKNLPETVLSRRGLFIARAKWSFSECQLIVKMIPTARARRDEDVGFGITKFGVTVEKL